MSIPCMATCVAESRRIAERWEPSGRTHSGLRRCLQIKHGLRSEPRATKKWTGTHENVSVFGSHFLSRHPHATSTPPGAGGGP